MSAAIDDFIEEARGVTVTAAAAIIGITVTKANHAGPCPVCGGKDRFSISPAKQAWNCRQCGRGGKDGISLMAHAGHHDVSHRSGFLAACADALGRDVPDGGEIETEADRDARHARIAAQRAANDAAATAQQGSEADFRRMAIDKGRGIYLMAGRAAGTDAARYLRLRTGFDMPAEVFANIRCDPKHTYWHGIDDFGRVASHHVGPAMVAPFVTCDGKITGCHETWIDLANGPKFRPDLGLDKKGLPLPTKKMQGVKKGSFIPLFGLLSSTRWVGGEGIENGLAIAGAENFRIDTFYFAAGDLGNLAGAADPNSAFRHPTATKADKNGRVSVVKVPGPVPKADQSPDDAIQIPDHVTDLVLLADGDSEIVFTAAAMARAENRMGRTENRMGRTVTTIWPPAGTDFAAMMVGSSL